MRARHWAASLLLLAACDGQLPDAVVPPAQEQARLIAAGDYFTCALPESGAPYCWGTNVLDQLGPGAPETRSTPAAVSGGPRLQLVSAGGDLACGVHGERAYCWGSNWSGELGAGLTDVSSAPALEVKGALDLRTVSVGLLHACALTRSGAAYCWGRNTNGELGTALAERCTNAALESFDCSHVPLRVADAPRFASISAGAEHTCALTPGGEAYCWGLNNWGQLGDGTTDLSPSPRRVAGSLRFSAIRAGARYTCALATDGAAHCWGRNDLGQLGTGSTAGATSPRPVAGGLRFASLELSRVTPTFVGFACGVTEGGAAYCWGSNRRGQLGTTTGVQPCDIGGRASTCATVPVAVSGGLSFRAVAAGAEHACGITTGGRAWCWGSNRAGELGNGATGFGTSAPVAVAGDLRFPPT